MSHGVEPRAAVVGGVATPATTTSAERGRRVKHWLMAAHPDPGGARRAWSMPYGAVAISCGTRFAAVRMPERLVHAVARTDEPTQVGVALLRALEGGPVIRDPRGRRYYALVPTSAATRWNLPGTRCLGHGAHLAVPRPDAATAHPLAAFWAVPMASPGELCDPAVLADFVCGGLGLLAGAAPPDLPLIRSTAAHVLGLDTPVPRHTDLDIAVGLLHSHYGVLLPEVERRAEAHAEGARLYAARSAVAEARARLGTCPGPTLQTATARARGLAHTLAQLCDQYEALTAADERRQP